MTKQNAKKVTKRDVNSPYESQNGMKMTKLMV